MTFLSGLNLNFSVFVYVSNREAAVRGLRILFFPNASTSAL